jgi:hypothetical protein
MGAAATLATGKLDLKSKSINYELLVSHMKIYGSFVLGKVTQSILLLSPQHYRQKKHTLQSVSPRSPRGF